ncbi:class I SAM-dependent methyltransferase [Peribacillus frigoritolerans]|uniref:class I SAM-dependent methyltransferase n=1 Tax=Peribacillus frigoritolerans TaxID=450367 RepID=UPI0034E07C14
MFLKHYHTLLTDFDKKWTFHEPKFQYENETASILTESAWIGHRYFAYDLVSFMKPQTVVELGTHWGLSFFSFCQAIVDNHINAKCYAVDGWRGDVHTGQYQENVYETVNNVVQSYYDPVAELVRKTFDEALHQFMDNSIDVLHIDGAHTYNDVSHDFYTWLPKLADNGVILFHDIRVRHGNFGVYKLWDELIIQYPHFEFDHSYGLGILFPKGCSVSFQEILAHKGEMKVRYQLKG